MAPGAFPGLGHATALYTDAVEFYRRGRDTLGPLFWVHLGFGNWVVMCVDREGFDLLRNKACGMAHLRRNVSVLVGDSILGQDGAIHQRMRSALSAPFTPKGLTATGFMATISEVMAERVARWTRSRSIPVLAEAQAVTLDLILRLIGVEVQDLSLWTKHHHDFGGAVFPLIPSYIPGSPMWRAERARVWIDAKLLAIVREERSRPSRATFISEICHGKDEQGRMLGERELVDNLRLLTQAGYDTTSGVLAWMTILLAQKPDLFRSLCEEATTTNKLPATPHDLRAYPFSEALFRESCRLYPPAAFATRELYEPVTVCGFPLPTGTVVYIATSLFGRDPELYPDPERFDVSRWIGRNHPPTPLELSQFGGGSHFCLGYHLALTQSMLFAQVLARELSRAGLRPRLADGAAPRHCHIPTGHPTPATRVEFVP